MEKECAAKTKKVHKINSGCTRALTEKQSSPRNHNMELMGMDSISTTGSLHTSSALPFVNENCKPVVLLRESVLILLPNRRMKELVSPSMTLKRWPAV